MIKIGLISLGCAKNRVDSELILGALAETAIITPDPMEADVIIVNTCGFIESAKQESIDTIFEMAEYKETGNLKGLIVTGCLSERYREELAREMPEVDAFLGMYAHKEIAEVITKVMNNDRVVSFPEFESEPDYTKRLLTTPFYQAYVRIAEGCDNRCSYCAIPYIRGNLRSRKIEDITAEVRVLVERGVSEIILVAQDTTVYGRDIYGKPMIVELMEELAGIEGVEWLRLLYAYPEGVTDELLDCMLKHDNIVKYIDIPIQHLSDSVLKRMNRRNTNASTYAAVKR
ncbi:MAG: MiaB/RimO family radical SAM methylthiotransferase, partial [Christensenellaceae bacterium]|nr:MiaB/RimO family radical SAM methylthiotransferase [Christensenellaceae bacterium]